MELRHIAAFLEWRWRRVSRRCGEATLILMLQHLQDAKLVSSPTATPVNQLGMLEQEYGRFLTQERGLMQSTVDLYRRMVRPFVSRQLQHGELRWDKLAARDVTSFVLRTTLKRGRRSKSIITGLRSLLGFLFQTGRTKDDLAAAIPAVPMSRPSTVPRFLLPNQVEKVLQSCDRLTKVGKRDYAVLLLLARLGLRSSEVTRLTLDDIDWIAGELVIRGKGARLDKLPLLQDIGDALADYLRKGRPRCSSRHVFVRSRAPHAGLVGASSLGSLVLRAMDRARIRSIHRGPHTLRHSLATRMLERRASLMEIGQVLRHQNFHTTEVYAKVDLVALRQLAFPWQGGAM
jgi:site-specific recombinase XerD